MELPVNIYRRLRRPWAGKDKRHDDREYPTPHQLHAAMCGAVATGARPSIAARRPPLALVRLLGAQCSLCQGIGCCECAGTGLY